MTEKSSLDLFRQALSEGLSNRFDSLAEEYTGEIVCSRKHKLAMRTIVYGKAGGARAWSPRMRRVVAILVAAALLLTSCGIIFRNEIREVFDELFVSLNYGEHGKEGYSIEKIYKLGYVPEGYVLEEEIITKISVNYKYINRNGFSLYFEQRPIIGLDYTIDSEEGYSKLENFEEIKVYYRVTSERHHYIWSDGKYSMKLNTSEQLTDEEIILIIEEITTK